MKSIQELFRVGSGPSSSHTMGPKKAAESFLHRNMKADRFRVSLFGSLAATGRGHLTDKALEETFTSFPLEILWYADEELPLHPNGMRFESFRDSELSDSWEVYSVGGGALYDGTVPPQSRSCYDLHSTQEIMGHCRETGETFWEYVVRCEGEDIFDFLGYIWEIMAHSMEQGLKHVGVLPGGLGVGRKAHTIHRKSALHGSLFQQHALVWSYALAVSEENAAGGTIVTAPTCGASGVLPAVLRYLSETQNCSFDDILRALATAGLFGNLVKYNASISGAEVGCQGEIGTACAMAAAAATQLLGGTIRQIEYAAEMGLEHHLGLTCDPVNGLVQIPCIERNAHAATRALSCCYFAMLSDGVHIISFDEITAVMKETGKALPSLYRETAEGGIASVYRNRPEKES